jgi:RNA polymerase sigma-70 factor (ECF subfamily)
VFLLREVFEFDYPQIAGILDRSEAGCRQLMTRARRHITARKPRFDADAAERDQLAARFFDAIGAGELEPLVSMLAADVVAYGDGGGNGPSLPRPVNGRGKVMRLLTALSGAIGDFGLHVQRVPVNGQPGALVLDDEGRLLNVLAIDILDGSVQAVRSIVNPDKLRHLGPLIGTGHPLRGGRATDDRPAARDAHRE